MEANDPSPDEVVPLETLGTSGTARADGRVVTIREVAAHAGVSIASVTRALNEYRHVSDELRKRVQASARELGYQPDYIAIGLRSGTTRTIGVIVSDIINPVLAQIVDRLELRFSTRRYGVLMANSHGSPQRDVESVDLMRQHRVDGLIVMCADEHARGLRSALERSKIPVVLIDREIGDESTFPAVAFDHGDGSLRTTRHLIERGHRRIGIVLPPLDATFSTRERFAGYRQALDEAGLPFEEELVRGGRPTAAFGKEATEALLALPDPPTGIINGSNPTSTGVLDGLRAAGLRIGVDIALTSLADHPVLQLHSPPVTAVVTELDEISDLAFNMLDAQLTGATRRGGRTMLPVRLEIRESSEAEFLPAVR